MKELANQAVKVESSIAVQAPLRMLKRIFITALLWPLLALAQSYPSPTFNNLTVQGTFTASGKVGLASLAAQAANTVVANVTASSASPTAVAIPSCSTSSSALQYTSGTGFVCYTSSASLAGATFTGTVTAPTLVSTGSILGPAAGYSIATVTGASSGGAIQVFDGTHGSNVSILNGGSSVAQFTSTGMTATGITGTPISGSTGSFTTLAASSTVSGAGFSTYLASPPAIGGTAAAAGSFTTLGASGLISPTSTIGIKGTTTNDSPAAGSVGENPTNNTTGTSMSNNTAANCTSQSLTAGNWMVGGVVTFTPSAAPTQIVAGTSTASASLGSGGTYQTIQASFNSGANQSVAAPIQFLKLASTTTVYLIGQSAFATGTMTCNGNIYAMRIR